jgi:hypothetical protein
MTSPGLELYKAEHTALAVRVARETYVHLARFAGDIAN